MSSLSKYTDIRFGGSQDILGDPYYNPSIIDRLLPHRQSENYMTELDRERVECNLAFMHGTMMDFKINTKFNKLVGLPNGTYSLRVTNSFLNLFVGNFLLEHYWSLEKEWTYPANDYKTDYIGMMGRRTDYDKDADKTVDVQYRIAYENYVLPKAYSFNGKNRVFSMMDTHKYRDIFQRSMYFFIGNQLFIGIRIIPFKDFSYLVIIPDDEYGLNSNIIQTLISDNTDWKMILAPQTNYSEAVLHPNDDFTEGGININLFTESDTTKAFINNDNAFLVAIRSGEITNAANLMDLHLSKIIKPEDGEYLYEINTSEVQFLQQLYGNNDVNVIVFHFRNLSQIIDMGSSKDPVMTDLMRWDDSSRNIFIVPPENVIVWKHDEVYGRIIPDPDTNVELWYPNTYSFSGEEFDTDQNNRIAFFCAAEKRYESTALDDRKNTPKFYCEIAPYIEYMGEKYPKKMVDGTICEQIKHYVPPRPEYSWREYMENVGSELPTDNNENSTWYKYQADKFKVFAEDEKNKIVDYANAIRHLYWKYIHEFDVSVKDINLMDQEPVMDNSGQRISESNKLITFTQPMRYIKINQRYNHPIEVMLYVDELYVVDRRIVEIGFDKYVYFPAYLIESDSVLHICIYEDYHDSEMTYNMVFTDTLASGEVNEHYLDENDNPIPPWPYQYFFYTINNEYLITVDDEYLVYGEAKVTDEVFGKNQNLPGYFNDFNPHGLLAYVNDSNHADYLKYLEVGKDKTLEVSYGIHLHKDEVEMLGDNEELLALMDEGDVTVDIDIPAGDAPVFNRVYSQIVNLGSEPDAYDTEYTSNDEIFNTDHELYIEFTEPYIRGCIYAPTNHRRSRYITYIDNELISEENRMKLHRYFTTKENREVCYIYLPKSIVTSTSTLRFETLCIDDRIPEGIRTFKNTPEIRIHLNDDNYTGVPISLISTDTYKYFRKDNVSATDEVTISGWKLGNNKKRIRIWLVEPTDGVGSYASLINEDDYDIAFPDTYGGDVSITFNHLGFQNKNLYIEHLPFDVTVAKYVTEYDPYSLLIFDVPNYYLDPFWEFFADGMRIPKDNILWLTPNKILLHDFDAFERLEMHHYDVLDKQIAESLGYYYVTRDDEFILTENDEKLYYGSPEEQETYDPANGIYVENIDPTQVVGYDYTTLFGEYITTKDDEIIFYGDPRSVVPGKYYTIIDHLLGVDPKFRIYYALKALNTPDFKFWK